MEWAAAWAVLKRVWWMIPVAVGLYMAYNWVWDRGHDSRNGEVAQLHSDVKKWHDAYDAQKETMRLQDAAHAKAIADLKTDQAGIVKSLSDQLDAAEHRAQKVKIITKEVIRYVSPATDAHFPVPVGLLRLHNDALSGEVGPETAAVPGGGPAPDDAASSTPASTLGRVIRDNYAECVARGEVIKGWQNWYATNKAAWQKAVQEQLSSPLVQPTAPP